MITLQTIQNAKLLEKYYFDSPTYTYQSLVGGKFTFEGWQKGVTNVKDLIAHHSGESSDNPFIPIPNGAWRSKLPSRNNWAFDVTLTRSSDNDYYYMSKVQYELNADGKTFKKDEFGKKIFEKWVRTTTRQPTVPILAPFDGYISALNEEANAYITLTPNNGGKTFVFMHGEWLAEAGQNSLPPGFNFYQVGKTFSKGEKIGLQGNRSEHGMLHHLHFEVNIGEKKVLETYVNNLLNGF